MNTSATFFAIVCSSPRIAGYPVTWEGIQGTAPGGWTPLISSGGYAVCRILRESNQTHEGGRWWQAADARRRCCGVGTGRERSFNRACVLADSDRRPRPARQIEYWTRYRGSNPLSRQFP